MELKNLLGLRSLTMILLIGTSITMTLYYLSSQENWQKTFQYYSGLYANLTAALQNDNYTFLKWQSTTDLDVNVSETLIEFSDKVKVSGINCRALFSGLNLNQATARTKANHPDIPLSDKVYVNLTEDCESFQASRGYIMSSLTKEEEDFPLAFSMLVFKDAEMVERLLRAIYRPQNYYCIHVDQKASVDFYNATVAIAKCFPNVFLSSRRVSVKWATFTVLEPELVCMQDLWKYPKWKYFINLTGQEFPLKTNLELVKILTAFRGASDVESTSKCAIKKRWLNKVPPYGLRPSKGGVHIAANRIFVDYILHNKTAGNVLKWTKETMIPDETFFAILNSNPQLGIKGTYNGTKDSCEDRDTMTRYKVWIYWSPKCAGRFARDICILRTGDLQRLVQSMKMFANKFYLNEDRTVIGCLEEKIFNDTRDEYLDLKTFNASFYSSLEFVINQVK